MVKLGMSCKEDPWCSVLLYSSDVGRQEMRSVSHLIVGSTRELTEWFWNGFKRSLSLYLLKATKMSLNKYRQDLTVLLKTTKQQALF